MFEQSIVCYGQNGRDKRYGKSSYRGNTDGSIVKDFLDFCGGKFKRSVKTCSDYMVGSGTTRDVCKERGITGTYWDLSMGKNLLDPDLEIPDRPETIFWHPPYSSLINIPYAGKEWGANAAEMDSYIQKYGYDPRKYDLGRMDWEPFVKALDYCVMKMYAAMETGGYIGILMGDIRRNGRYYSMLRDIALPGEMQSIVIKQQVNATSYRRTYSGNSFIPIVHEFFVICKKPDAYIIDYTFCRHVSMDIRNSMNATWKDVIAAVIEAHKAPMTREEIYEEVKGYKKAENNHHLPEKIRQTLNSYKDVFICANGRVALAT